VSRPQPDYKTPGMMLRAEHLTKTYRVAAKEPGVVGALRHLVRRTYREVQAVRDVSFSVEAGEFVGFVGANGAGKTTTLKMLSGLIRPSEGTVSVSGQDPFRRQKAFLRQITLVMGQKQQLIWDLPAQDSLRINAAVYEIDPPEAKRRIGELAEMLEVSSLLKQPVRKLSLGERMKCELLAALLHRPQILFLDEPTLGLDINAQEAIRNFLRQYNQTFAATVLLTSHYMADITALCSRVLLIHEGQLIYDGALADIVQRFAPYRELEIRLAEPRTSEELETFGEVANLDGLSVRLIVDRSKVRDAVVRVFEELKPTDLYVKEPAIERIIGPLLKGQGLGPSDG